jgi:hypothetical protein
MQITLAKVLALDEAKLGNRIRQIAELPTQAEGTLTTFTRDRLQGVLFRSIDGLETIIIPKAKPIPLGIQRAVQAVAPLDAAALDLRDAAWLRHPILTAAASRAFDYGRELQMVLDSWVGAFIGIGLQGEVPIYIRPRAC